METVTQFANPNASDNFSDVLENPNVKFVLDEYDYFLHKTPEEIELRIKRKKEELNENYMKGILDEIDEILHSEDIEDILHYDHIVVIDNKMDYILYSEEFSSEEKIEFIDKVIKLIEERFDLYSDSMLALKNEFLRVKDNDGFYSEFIKGLFEDGSYAFQLDLYTSVKEDFHKIMDFIWKHNIQYENCVVCPLDDTGIYCDIHQDENYRSAQMAFRFEVLKQIYEKS